MGPRLLPSVLVAVLALAGAGVAAAADGTANPYTPSHPFRTAVVHYRLTSEVGHGAPGTKPGARTPLGDGHQVIWIEGDRLAKLTTLKGVETLEIYTPDHVYTIDVAKKVGTRIDNPKKPGRLAWAQLSDAARAAFQARLHARGVVSFDLPHLGARAGAETVAGEQCEVYELGAAPRGPALAPRGSARDRWVKTCVWARSIPLRVVRASFLRRDEMVATRIDRDVPIPESRFTVPDGVTVTHDAERSEVERRYAVARFELFKSGAPIVMRLPAPGRGAGDAGEALP